MIPKFRAFHKERKVMCDIIEIGFRNKKATLDLETKEDEYYWSTTTAFFDEVVIMQSTGLKDKNGVEIYEDDIVQSDHYFKYQVVFKGDCWRCEPLKNKRYKNRFIGGDLEVIGNIWENLELTEENE